MADHARDNFQTSGCTIVFRKVTNGFRSDWGSQIHAGYRSVTGTARLSGTSALCAIRNLVDGTFAVA